VTSIGVRINGWRSSLPSWAGGARESRAAARELTPAAAAVQWVLIAVAGLAVWLGLFGIGISALQEQHAQHGLYAQYREQLARGTAPVGGAMAEGSPVALLHSLRGGLDDVVAVEGTSSTDLRSGPGHYPASVLPGQAGISYVMGRSTSYGGPFGGITDLRPNDRIVVTTGQGRFTYYVTDVRRAGDPVPTLAPGQSRLTLVTSEGTGWRSGWAPSHAVFVDATLRGKPVAAPAAVGSAPTEDGLMRRDKSQLYPLVLWLQLLLLGVVGVVVGRAKWGTWQSWIVGVPVVLAALWGASNAAWVLLPNLV